MNARKAVRISIIAAIAENGVIGRDNALPWRLSADLQYFKKITLGKPIIMGRNTYESIGKPLPGRKNIVVTRNPQYVLDNCVVTHSLTSAISVAMEDNSEEIMIIGGAQLYREAMSGLSSASTPVSSESWSTESWSTESLESLAVTHLYITEVHHSVAGDAMFPVIENAHWQEISREHHSADNKNQYDYSFVVYKRR